jgi:hypothetical protein
MPNLCSDVTEHLFDTAVPECYAQRQPTEQEFDS